jgi:hypothetical protein
MKKLSYIVIALVIYSVSVFAALDLKFNGAIAIAPAAPSAGASVTFSVNFIPSGAAVDNLKCTFGIDAAQISERTFAHINAGASRLLSFTWVATAGTHKVWFKLDPNNTTGDSNIQNNSIEKTFSVSGSGGSLVSNIANITGKRPLMNQPVLSLAAKPNLKLEVAHDVVHVNAAESYDHQPYNKLVFKIIVRNTGGGPSVQTLLEMKVDMGYEFPSLIPPIAANSMYIITREIRCLGTSYLFTFTADPINSNDEVDETDNTWSQMVPGC